MNTITLIFLVFFFLGCIGLLVSLLNKSRKADDKQERNAYLIYATLIVLILGGTILSLLNVYGVARLPLLNEVRSKIPESFTPTENPINPQTNGPVQQPSQPSFEEHKRSMEQLKQNGL